uniref:Uncharacterized protein n=1 Tax=Anopheles melas TaxID=34690 RepID=A0A182UGE1_9DIPT
MALKLEPDVAQLYCGYWENRTTRSGWSRSTSRKVSSVSGFTYRNATSPCTFVHFRIGEPPPISLYFFCTSGVRRFAIQGPSLLEVIFNHYLNRTEQRLVVHLLELVLNVLQIDLRPGDDDADQRFVVRAETVHCFEQLLGKEVGCHLNTLDDRAKGVVEITADLRLQCLLDRTPGKLLVLLEHQLQLGEGCVGQNLVKHRLIRAELGLARIVQLLCLLDGQIGIGRLRRVLARAGNNQAAGRFRAHVLGQRSIVHRLVRAGNLVHLIVVLRAQYLDQRLLVRPDAVHRFVQLLAQVVDRRCHQAYNDIFEFAAQLGLQVLHEVPAQLVLEGGLYLLPLIVAPGAQYVDDGLLVRTEALHRFAKGGSILRWVEVFRRNYGGLGL